MGRLLTAPDDDAPFIDRAARRADLPLDGGLAGVTAEV